MVMEQLSGIKVSLLPNANLILLGRQCDKNIIYTSWGQEEKGMTEYEMAGWHHWLDGHEFE